VAEYNVRKIQLIELEILNEFDRICKKYGLQYFLTAGTAIGAVRHGGFIPWDDDIDVGMLREEYEKFIRIAPKELKDEYFLQTLESDPKCPCLFAKIRKNGTIYQENNKVGMKMHRGIWIDIFPFDYISTNKKEQRDIISKSNRYIHFFMLKKIPHIYQNTSQPRVLFYTKAFIRKIIHILLQIIPDGFFISGIQKIIDDEKEKKDAVTSFFYTVPFVWRTKQIVPVGSIEFEGREYSIVRNPDYFLRVQFGDYMELPPVEKRVGHRPLYVDYGEN